MSRQEERKPKVVLSYDLVFRAVTPTKQERGTTVAARFPRKTAVSGARTASECYTYSGFMRMFLNCTFDPK